MARKKFNVSEGKKGFQRTAPVVKSPEGGGWSPRFGHPYSPSPLRNDDESLDDAGIGKYDSTYSHYEKHVGKNESVGAMDSSEMNKCDLCGRFMDADGGHECGVKMSSQMQKMAVVAPALGAATVFGGAAGVFALTSGYVVPLVVAGFVVAGLGIRKFFASRGFSGNKLNDLARERKFDGHEGTAAWVDNVQSRVNTIAEHMGVEGDIVVLLNPSSKNADKLHGTAGAAWVRKGKGMVKISKDLMALPPEQLDGILAHEIAHLQKRYPAGMRNIFKRAALPVGLAAGVATGFAAIPAASVAALVWFSSKMASSAMSRREERRADREAYKFSGENFAESLKEIHKLSPQVRDDLPWRVEDVVFTHPNLPNRLADMRS